MNLSADPYTPDEQHPSHPFSDVVHLFRDFISRLVRFFTVTEEERSKAGIVFIDEMRDK